MKFNLESLLFVILAVCGSSRVLCEESEGMCECSVFTAERSGGWRPGDEASGNWHTCGTNRSESDPTRTLTCEPMFVKASGLKVPCGDGHGGRGMCKDICVAMALVVKAKAPEMICYLVTSDARGITASVFFRTCDIDNAAKWIYSGLSSRSPICCRNSIHVPCQQYDSNT